MGTSKNEQLAFLVLLRCIEKMFSGIILNVSGSNRKQQKFTRIERVFLFKKYFRGYKKAHYFLRFLIDPFLNIV